MLKAPSQTKIVATLGPVSWSTDIIKKLIIEGVDVFRLNFSHGDLKTHKNSIENIRKANNESQTNIAILADLQGPKIRVGEIDSNRLELNKNDIITFINTPCTGTKEHIYISYQQFAKDVQVNEIMLIDDGKIQLQITETNGVDTVKAKVIYGGILSSKKGLNLPNTKVSLPSLTEEDIVNAEFALDNNVDWIALSFVRTSTDILDLKDLIKKKKGHAGVVAKIEKPEALNEIDQIIDLTDAVMIARGDLGVEIPFDQVPLIQKTIVDKCLRKAKPVIIATQMMESMIDNFRPTRAEATDVANAVLDGADALMLSGETSVGKFPVETITSMQRIISYTELNSKIFYKDYEPAKGTITFHSDSICFNATRLAHQVEAKAIMVFTHSGYTACKIASQRPKADIYAFTSNEKLVNKMSLSWGVEAFYFKSQENINQAIEEATNILKNKGLAKESDTVIIVGSIPLRLHGRANMMKVSYVN